MSAPDPAPPPPFDEAAVRRQLASREMMALVALWERPMSAELRAMLRAELDRRTYRLSSLPPPPPDDPDARPLPPPVWEDFRHAYVGYGMMRLLALGQLFFAAQAANESRTNGMFGGEARQAFRAGDELPLFLFTTASIGFPLVVALVLFVLSRRVREKPHPTLAIAFRVLLGLLAAQVALSLAFGDLELVLGSVVLQGVTLIALGSGAAASKRLWGGRPSTDPNARDA